MTVSLWAAADIPLLRGGEGTMGGRKERGLALIAYRCSEASHERARTREASTITYHVDGWAFCASPGPHGHRWIATGGVHLRELLIRRGSRVS